LSKTFVFNGGEIKFLEGPRLNPSLNLELTRKTSDLTAFVRVGGTMSDPKLSWESQPPYPSDEVLSQVLFGKKVSQLSRVEALQLANSLRVMAGLGGPIVFNVINNLRDTLHLSVLRVGESSQGASNRILDGNSFRNNLDLNDDGNSEEDSTTIEAGRYLSENVYVGLEQNLTDNSTGVRVEVELSPMLSLQSLTSSNSNRVGLGWKKDY
jgi:translocation and assembly module TamB